MNDPMIHAKASKIVEAIENQIIGDKPNASSVALIQQLTPEIRKALASLESKNKLERFDAEDWLCKQKDIWNHPRVTDRNDKQSYEVADLMAEFANWHYGKQEQPPHTSEREVLERFENIAGHMIPSPDGGWIRYAELFYKYPNLAEKGGNG